MATTMHIDGIRIERIDGVLMVSRTEPAEAPQTHDDGELAFVPDPEYRDDTDD